jgi:hypothetical protein
VGGSRLFGKELQVIESIKMEDGTFSDDAAASRALLEWALAALDSGRKLNELGAVVDQADPSARRALLATRAELRDAFPEVSWPVDPTNALHVWVQDRSKGGFIQVSEEQIRNAR